MGEPPAHPHPRCSQQLTVCFPAEVRAWCVSVPPPVQPDRADPSACTAALHPAALGTGIWVTTTALLGERSALTSFEQES